MRKITPEQRARDRRRSYLARSRPSTNLGYTQRRNGAQVRRLFAPETFCLFEEKARDQLFTVVGQAEQALAQGHRAYISFSKTKKLWPCGTLYFIANMERARAKYGARLMFDYPTDEVVLQLFQHVGLLELAGLSNRTQITAENVKHWHIVRGSTTDVSGFEALQKEYWNTLGPALGMVLGGSMGEAVTNCVQHAYAKTGEPVQWWMFAQYREGKLNVAILDQGIGIANSLRQKPHLIDTIRRWFRKPKHDCKLLACAVGSKLSRTKLPHRGKGLPEMLENVRDSNLGSLTIHSNHGFFLYRSKDKFEQHHFFEQPLHGTLVLWIVPIAGEE